MKIDKYSRIDRAKACLTIGALGDALGASVEFMSYGQITSTFGAGGIRFLDQAYGKKGAITDDTQMTLFAADGLISAYKRGAERGILGEYWGYTAMSYLRWLETQDYKNAEYPDLQWWGSSELYELVKAQGTRGPGNTCLSALKAVKKSCEPANNDSKGCGTVMRVAPVGIFFASLTDELDEKALKNIYDEGVKDAAITHGNITAHHSSGLLAVIYALTLNGSDLAVAVRQSLDEFATPDISELCEKAVKLAEQPPSRENLELLGEGWIAEEAMAIGLYCALLCTTQNMPVIDALRLSVNHSGDSDSTGAITGNLIGISRGMDAVPHELLSPDSEVASLGKLFSDYGEELVTITDYRAVSNSNS